MSDIELHWCSRNSMSSIDICLLLWELCIEHHCFTAALGLYIEDFSLHLPFSIILSFTSSFYVLYFDIPLLCIFPPVLSHTLSDPSDLLFPTPTISPTPPLLFFFFSLSLLSQPLRTSQHKPSGPEDMTWVPLY